MHLIELRTAPQGHPAYRRVCQQMHTLIAKAAGHEAVAASSGSDWVSSKRSASGDLASTVLAT